MSSVNVQIQRAKSESINEQVLLQVQASLGASSGLMTREKVRKTRGNVQSES